MENLKEHELFEINTLQWLKNRRFLVPLVFGGGTLLRLCHELPRYSADLDFWFYRKIDYAVYFDKLAQSLKENYNLTDAANKRFTLVFEIQPAAGRQRLKIEIRKEVALPQSTEEKIAFSTAGSIQVLLRGFTLLQMAQNKVKAFLDRGEIRDVFDLEFLLRKGIQPDLEPDTIKSLLSRLQKLKKHDFDVKLGSLLMPELRDYYRVHGFSFLTERFRQD
ncbi:MAG: nucleotidyl transferase AbiEii/AbiGii toxin family protein [Proteobacteria bacterium]|nr:nucleotidyl transferase AbiEii/AbiGii toxin family protein [Pseudomonadota bacterium]